MPLPPLPDGVPAAAAADFVPAPCGWPRLRILLLASCAVCLGWATIQRWGGGPIGVAGALAAGCGWLAAVVAQWVCLRKDKPVALTVVAVELEQSQRGALAEWQFEELVSPALRRRDMLANWAQTVKPGDQIAARVQETGFGTISLVIGTPTVEGWRLPPPSPPWPVAAQVNATLAFLAFGAVAVLALAPSECVIGSIADARQHRWVTGLGQVAWDVAVDLPAEPDAGPPEQVQFELTHAELLSFLPPEGSAALAAPGNLPASEREQLWDKYLPIGAGVDLRRTHLGPLETLFYVGPTR